MNPPASVLVALEALRASGPPSGAWTRGLIWELASPSEDGLVSGEEARLDPEVEWVVLPDGEDWKAEYRPRTRTQRIRAAILQWQGSPAGEPFFAAWRALQADLPAEELAPTDSDSFFLSWAHRKMDEMWTEAVHPLPNFRQRED